MTANGSTRGQRPTLCVAVAPEVASVQVTVPVAAPVVTVPEQDVSVCTVTVPIETPATPAAESDGAADVQVVPIPVNVTSVDVDGRSRDGAASMEIPEWGIHGCTIPNQGATGPPLEPTASFIDHVLWVGTVALSSVKVRSTVELSHK